MKICIVTVYNSLNLGSYLQANALRSVLEEYGEVCFLNTHARNPRTKAIKGIIKSCIKLSPKHFKLAVNKYKVFMKIQKKFRVCELSDLDENTLFVFGSDEIWNICRRNMSDFPVFWGDGIIGKKFSYAPSLNLATKEQLSKWRYTNCLQKFIGVSVRDEHSKEMIQPYYHDEVQVVLDPTMLLDYSYYNKKAKQIYMKDYIAVYVFSDRMTDEKIYNIKEIAKRLNKRLIGVGEYFDWCDECVVSENSFDFFINADYTIVNTFHGTVFSILLRKKFISFADSNKVKDLLNEFGVADQDVRISDLETMLKKINNDIDYVKIEELLQEKRGYSMKYINSCMDNVINK